MGYLTETIEAVQRARRPLFQFSGGRDSLCTLFLLYESGCSNFDIVWVNTGDAAPETTKLVNYIKTLWGDRLYEVRTDSRTWRKTNGDPSPLVRCEEAFPWVAECSNEQYHVQPQSSCCAANVMNPMHEFTVGGGYDLVIRGNRGSEPLKTAAGHLQKTDAPYTLAYPIYDWTTPQVDMYLVKRNMLPSFYDFMDSGVDCMTCPAFWGNGHQKWLATYYPDVAQERQHNIEKLMSYMSNVIQLGFNELDLRGV